MLPPNIINLTSVWTYTPTFFSLYTARIPSLLDSIKMISEAEPDEILISTPGPMGFLGLLAVRLLHIPCKGIYHTDFSRQASLITGDDTVSRVLEDYCRWFYRQCDEIKVPTKEYIGILSERHYPEDKMTVFYRGVEHSIFSPQSDARRKIKDRFNLPEQCINLLYVFWDTIIINHIMRKVIRRFVHERREAIHDGYRALHKIREMKKIAAKLGLETDDLTFQYATFKILAVAREYYFGPWDETIARRLTELVNDYRKQYPEGFHIILDFNPVHLKKWLIKTIFRFSLRMHPHYRFLDMLILLRFASLIYPLFRIWEKRRMPTFTRSQAMGIEVLFK